jgi:hypothetical protein
VVIVSECAKGEVVVNSESAEFGVCAFAEVAGEEAEREAVVGGS